ncbi:MAG: heavy metal translocating P-type ATPase [Demequina sp.]|nr:heavy metal translocating P-type ATPase [Demequina sp.]
MDHADHGAGADHHARQDHGAHEDHKAHADHSGHAEMFRHLFWINLALAIPVVLFSAMVQDWLGFSLSVPGSSWIPPVVGTVIFVWGGRPFFTMAVPELRNRQPGMMLLISLAISVAFLASLASTFGIGSLDFWWELATLIVVMLLGHWQEMKAVGQASSALAALAELLPDEAERVVGDDVETVRIAELVTGDVVVVRPGARVPADGTIAQGSASMDESTITGESAPVRRGEGERVVAGTVATDGSLRVEITAVGDDTALAGIQRMVTQAQESRSGARKLADRAAQALFYIALGSAMVTFTVYTAQGDLSTGVVRAVTVLVIACPHALGLAIPLVIAISTAKSAKAGVLVKDVLALEAMRSISSVLFDKTGTLTEGSHTVAEVEPLDDWDEPRVLAVAAAVERDSEHPIGRAIVAAAADRDISVADASDVDTHPGKGVVGIVDGDRVGVGGRSMLAELNIEAPEAAVGTRERWEREGSPTLYVTVGDVVVGLFTTRDPVRDASRATVDALHRQGVSVALITGDSQAVADRVARELGIDEVFAEVLPQDKDSAVEKLQAGGGKVAMVGDGVNDAPALARADVGIAIGAGTDVAIEAAGVVLASSDPRGVLAIVALSRASHRKMIQNLVWATGYNALAIPVAAGAFTGIGFALNPAAAAVAMSLSTIVVALNAQLLRRVDLSYDALAPADAAAQPQTEHQARPEEEVSPV